MSFSVSFALLCRLSLFSRKKKHSHPSQGRNEARLPRPRGTDDGDQVSAVEGERDIAERRQGVLESRGAAAEEGQRGRRRRQQRRRRRLRRTRPGE